MSAKNDKNGCDTVNKLWNIALECNIEKPGVYGVGDRMIGFIQCKNIRDFLVMATLKCWEERSKSNNNISFPPIVVVDDPNIIKNNYDNKTNKTNQNESNKLNK